MRKEDNSDREYCFRYRKSEVPPLRRQDWIVQLQIGSEKEKQSEYVCWHARLPDVNEGAGERYVLERQNSTYCRLRQGLPSSK